MYDDEEQRKNDEDYMRGLYERFRKEVDSGKPIEYYEINELLDIYDFAQDEGDLLVQFFVFLTFSRLYPDSNELDERMAFFLSYISSDAANDMIMRQGRQDTPLWDVLKMGVKCYPSGNPEPFIVDIINKYEKLDCESTLKIIDLLREISALELLAKYYDQLAKRAEDPRGFAFEVAETLKESDATRLKARDVAEELTTLEPFNIEAWLLLARLEFGLLHPEEALAAVDYALAIDPEHFNAKVTRAVILVGIDNRRQEAIAALTEILKIDPKNIFALEGLAEALRRDGKKNEACEIYGMILQSQLQPGNAVNPLYEIILNEPDNLEDYIKLAVGMGILTEAEWHLRMSTLHDEGRVDLAAEVMDTVYRTAGLTKALPFFLLLLYDAKRFERLIEVFEEAVQDRSNPASKPGFFSLTDYLLLTAAYLRAGRREEAAQLAEAIGNRPEKGNTPDEVMKYRGIYITAGFIRTLASDTNITVNLRDFDPLSSDFLPLTPHAAD